MTFNIYNYSDDVRQALLNFEQDVKDKIQSFLQPACDWKCRMKMTLDEMDCSKKNEQFISNASFSMKGSYDVSNKTKQYFTSRLKGFAAKYLLPDQILTLELLFSELTETEKQALSEKRKTEEKRSTNTSTVTEPEPSFFPQAPLYPLSKVILPSHIKEEIESAISILKYQDLIYNTWGFNQIDPVAKSVLNFYGPPGTGKTMCAHGVAHELNKPLLALNYAEIESKYVGEAPKNLMRAFNCAKENDAVLFFDEADSFLGKRIQNVTQGADQALNSLRSQMLMLLEQHPGVIIFATNLVSNFDSAFESRILKHIKFELPNKEARTIIIKNMMPPFLPWVEAPQEDGFIELSTLSEGFSGREIKSAILETLLAKVSESGYKAMFEIEDFKNRFIHKSEEKRKLKEESEIRLKEKITNAIQRQGLVDANKSETSSESSSESAKEEKEQTSNNNHASN